MQDEYEQNDFDTGELADVWCYNCSYIFASMSPEDRKCPKCAAS